MAIPGAFSWNSELPSGHNPFWIRDEGLSGIGLHVGDAVSIDTHANPKDGDLVVVEAELDDDSIRLARRYFARGDTVRLEPVGAAGIEVLELGEASVMVMGVIVGRVRFSPSGAGGAEEPL